MQDDPMGKFLGIIFFSVLLLVGFGVAGSIRTVTTATDSSGSVSSDAWFRGIGHRHVYDTNMWSLANTIHNLNADSEREAMILSHDPESLYFTQLKANLDGNGLGLIIQTCGVTTYDFTANPVEEDNIINNVGGAGDDWITGWASVIAVLDPYGIQVMNEPSNGGTWATANETAFAAYRQFCIDCITAWRTVSPNLTVMVQNYPFNDPFNSTAYGFAETPLAFENIIYEVHVYYSWDGGYPPEYLPEQRAYWDAVDAADLAAARVLLEDFIDEICEGMLDAGELIYWGECGANNAAPNYLVFIEDFIDLSYAKGVGISQYEVSYDAPTALVNGLWEPNAQGYLFQEKFS